MENIRPANGEPGQLMPIIVTCGLLSLIKVAPSDLMAAVKFKAASDLGMAALKPAFVRQLAPDLILPFSLTLARPWV